jgi:hypothetical protein
MHCPLVTGGLPSTPAELPRSGQLGATVHAGAFLPALAGISPPPSLPPPRAG